MKERLREKRGGMEEVFEVGELAETERTHHSQGEDSRR